MRLFSEWFWSEASAKAAGKRIEAHGCYRTTVRYAMSTDGRHDWLLETFSA